jgi:phosphoribosyl-ATP pyrophosphohydrolase/phosphoribosyl-AMP cyclohydrolase
MNVRTPAFIAELETIIRERIAEDSADSYTARLVRAGNRRVAQKVAEEGVEVALAATSGNRDELLDEAADLVYHLLVLLAVNDAKLADVANVLARRHAI